MIAALLVLWHQQLACSEIFMATNDLGGVRQGKINMFHISGFAIWENWET